jgi:8-oxo-dGTP pyrophosphatase MutT (NUDIX family)
MNLCVLLPHPDASKYAAPKTISSNTDGTSLRMLSFHFWKSVEQYTARQMQLQGRTEPLSLHVHPCFSIFESMLTYENIRLQFAHEGGTKRKVLSIPGYAHAGVLVPLVSTKCSLELLFTKRTEKVETHKGQISFPGGMVDATDRDIIHTALREAEEEIGLTHDKIEVIGLLDDMATPSGFVITPVVGIVEELPELFPNHDEVAEVFRVDLEFFADESNGRTEFREVKGLSYEVWFYPYGDHLIWGATAMMIRSLLKKIKPF